MNLELEPGGNKRVYMAGPISFSPQEGVEAEALSKAAMAQAKVDEQLAAEAVKLARADQLPGLRADLLLILADILQAGGLEGRDRGQG